MGSRVKIIIKVKMTSATMLWHTLMSWDWVLGVKC